MSTTNRVGLLALALAAACAEAPQPPQAVAPPGADGETSPIEATGVELRLPQPGGGDVVIAGGAFALGPDLSGSLEGGVRAWSERGMPFEATASRASLADGGRIAVLEGGVRAVLSIGRPWGDAGATDE